MYNTHLYYDIYLAFLSFAVPRILKPYNKSQKDIKNPLLWAHNIIMMVALLSGGDDDGGGGSSGAHSVVQIYIIWMQDFSFFFSFISCITHTHTRIYIHIYIVIPYMYTLARMHSDTSCGAYNSV